MKKLELLSMFSLEELDGRPILFFNEGGRKFKVQQYDDQDRAERFYVEDSLFFWMKILKRTWYEEES